MCAVLCICIWEFNSIVGWFHSHCMMSMIRLLTEGGIPFDAMHKYAPMCKRLTFDTFNHDPFTVTTENYNFKNIFNNLIKSRVK